MIPKRLLCRIACAALATAISDLDGIHPLFRQSPPILCRSINTVLAPIIAAPAATERPPDPAPTPTAAPTFFSAAPSSTRLPREGGRPASSTRRSLKTWHRFSSCAGITPGWVSPGKAAQTQPGPPSARCPPRSRLTTACRSAWRRRWRPACSKESGARPPPGWIATLSRGLL